MQKYLVHLIWLILLAGCQPASIDEQVPPSKVSTPLGTQTNEVDLPKTTPTKMILLVPSPVESVDNESRNLQDGDQMPVFLEATQTTSMIKNSVQSPVIGVGPTIYFYNPENKVLMLQPTIALESKTELIIGVTTVLQTPNEVFDNREIVQFPSAQPALIQIASFNEDIELVGLVYGDESFDLSPGESRTFKRVGESSNISTIITVISNYGRLADIQPISSDGSLR